MIRVDPGAAAAGPASRPAPTAAAREGDRQDDAVHRGAVVRAAGQGGEPHRPEQLAAHQPHAADRGQQQHQPHRPVGDRQPDRPGDGRRHLPGPRDERSAPRCPPAAVAPR